MADDFFLTGYRYGNGVRLALHKGNKLYGLQERMIPSFDAILMHIPASELITRLSAAIAGALPADTRTTLKGLLNQQPIWAAGVTYKTSEEARERESANSTVYTRVYAAARPEVFWKSVGYEAASSDDPVGIRYDATWSVPEPELTAVFNARGEAIGFTIGNDMSSRDIEGENPLYLPQAKVYDESCALGPRIWLLPDAERWPETDIHIRIERAGAEVFSGATSTTRLNRKLPELVNFLTRCKKFPYGVLLMTGTGVVPPDSFTLQAGDVIRIRIDPIGELVNTVKVVGNAPAQPDASEEA
ncbi:MAG: fumarylacetoacetate hydrolase family protein [Anaerolineae bacterium]|nr:fumarylacetoacetate hydrolase family protein [Anaerolineae bacterium]